MPVTVGQLATMEVEAQALFLRGLQSVSNSMYERLCQQITMSTKSVETPIAGMLGALREWTGERQVERLSRDAYTITAKKFEKTVAVPREAFEDDTVGVYLAGLQSLGEQSAAWPDQQVAAKLEAGETDTCYDETAFFNASHPVEHGNAAAGTFSNLSGSGNPAWYLFDLSKSVKPLLWATRQKPEMVNKWDPDDDNVFWLDEYLSGVRARGVADYGFPQLCYKSKAALNSSNYESAVEAMMAYQNGKGENLGVYPTLLVVPTSLKGDAKRLFEKEFVSSGETNEYYKDIDWVVWQRLSTS